MSSPSETVGETCAAAFGASASSIGLLGTSLPVIVAVLFASAVLLAVPTVIWLLAYLLPHLYVTFRSVPNLKQRYNADWALVTGGGSGIGRSLAFKLASQGLNVVIVSLDDDCLRKTVDELRQNYPGQEFRPVGVTFAPAPNDYMTPIKNATNDIDVQCIFNNAGFLVTGFFDQAPLPKLLANIECNATAAFQITHHFLSKLVARNLPGCVVFTSSVAGYVPTPFSASYGATKAFVSQLASCLHVELAALGIDVCAVHPSPVESNFYAKLDHKIDLLESARKQAVQPDALPDQILKSIGVCALRDIGGMALGVRMGTFFLPYNFFTRVFAVAAPYLPDYKTHNSNRM